MGSLDTEQPKIHAHINIWELPRTQRWVKTPNDATVRDLQALTAESTTSVDDKPYAFPAMSSCQHKTSPTQG